MQSGLRTRHTYDKYFRMQALCPAFQTADSREAERGEGGSRVVDVLYFLHEPEKSFCLNKQNQRGFPAQKIHLETRREGRKMPLFITMTILLPCE